MSKHMKRKTTNKATKKKKPAKKLLTMRVSTYDGGFRVSLSNKMGYVNIVRTLPGDFETHSWLDPTLRGKGLGVKAYGRAIEYCLKHGHSIKSSNNPSDEAVRVWQSKRLREKYRIHKRGNRFCVIGIR